MKCRGIRISSIVMKYIHRGSFSFIDIFSSPVRSTRHPGDPGSLLRLTVLKFCMQVFQHQIFG